MKLGDLLPMIIAAALIAGAVAFFVVPKVNQLPDQAAKNAQTAPPTLATATTTPLDDDVPFDNASIIKKRDDGHYWALADVDGFPINFMVDTGASIVALTYKDAQRLRLDPETLDYKWKISTAGGETFGASVLLDSVRIGQVEVENVEAMVLREGLTQSLLGMSFLGELYSYEFKKKSLIIRQ